MTDEEGGRIFFSTRGPRLMIDDDIVLTSVGVDIGSSTSHLVFSRIRLERLDSRYVVSARTILYQSDILLTPFIGDRIDEAALRAFVDAQYARAGLSPAAIDSGALVLTGLAVRRANARAIGEVFAREAGKLVAVSAGDGLEAVMAAYGSGAVARSIRERQPVVNVDIGGGTAKIAICVEGVIVERTAADIGARVLVVDGARRIVRIEEAGRWFAGRLGLALTVGDILSPDTARALAEAMAAYLFAIMRGDAAGAGADPLLRLEPLRPNAIAAVTLSGGVAEFIGAAQSRDFGDLGPLLATAFVDRLRQAGIAPIRADEAIRATVVGAAQYTAQVSGDTIYVAPQDMLPLRNVPVVAPILPLDADPLDRGAITAAVAEALRLVDLDQRSDPVAIFVRWRGAASFARLDAFARGVLDALTPARPLVLVGDSDVGGLIGIHIRHEIGHGGPIASLDGLELKAFDHIDLGEIFDARGAVPVVIKSLVFPADARIGRAGPDGY